jgi:polyphosphate kinase 2 (PPK2 family)
MPLLHTTVKTRKTNTALMTVKARIEKEARKISVLAGKDTTIVKYFLHIYLVEEWDRLISRMDDPQRICPFSMGNL